MCVEQCQAGGKVSLIDSYALIVIRQHGASLVAQLVKNPPAVRETWVCSPGWEDPLEKGTATHSLFWPGEFHGLYIVLGVAKSWTRLSDFHSLTHSLNNMTTTEKEQQCAILDTRLSSASNPRGVSPSIRQPRRRMAKLNPFQVPGVNQ